MSELSDEIVRRIDALNRGKINVYEVYPPIPTRAFDWCASFDNDEPDDDGHMLCGYGKTQIAAIIDLLDNAEALAP